MINSCSTCKFINREDTAEHVSAVEMRVCFLLKSSTDTNPLFQTIKMNGLSSLAEPSSYKPGVVGNHPPSPITTTVLRKFHGYGPLHSEIFNETP